MVYECKICGAALEFEENSTVTKCKYCQTMQTLPKKKNEGATNLLNRANRLRLKCEFDKAQDIYEKVIEGGSNDSEAYWGLVLCKYGIEYVEDPATRERVPTCHRTQIEPVLTDIDYQSVIADADSAQKAIYEQEAKAIDKVQKGILSIVNKEEPYDVFICYKETDENGNRTKDSVIANDIYYQLTQVGYKVFYAAITLEDKLGMEYEPYIFAALNSARVMLVVGTKPEYFNAVWVKNEWARYIKIMAKDKKRLLVPCYRDMDAYDLPIEFAHLQAQDMGKIGFIEDLIRGIKKIIKKDEPKKETVIIQQEVAATTATAPAIKPLLKRAQIFLEDKDFAQADEYAEKVLDVEPECADAYLIKLLVDLKLSSEGLLEKQAKPYLGNPNYVKAVRYASGERLKQIKDYGDTVCKNIYSRLIDRMNAAKTSKELLSVEAGWREIVGYADSEEMLQECESRREDLEYEEDSEGNYQSALAAASEGTIEGYELAISLLEDNTYDYQDASELLDEWEEKRDKLYAEKEAAELKAKQEKETAEKIAKQKQEELDQKRKKYKQAVELMRNKSYVQAKNLFTELGSFENSGEFRMECNKQIATIEAAAKKKRRKKIKKTVTSLILVAILAVGGFFGYTTYKKLFPTVDGLKFRKDTDSYIVTGMKDETATSIVIPAKVNDLPVTGIDGKAFESSVLLKITIPESVTKIESDAFTFCHKLKQVYYGGTIDKWVKIIFANSYACPLYYEASLFIDKQKVTEATISSNINNFAFYGCGSLEKVTIANGVHSIGEYVFFSCKNLTSVTFKNVNGWQYYISGSFGGSWKDISSGDLSDPEQAATALKDEFSKFSWKKA